jgi:hypothetical protein
MPRNIEESIQKSVQKTLNLGRRAAELEASAKNRENKRRNTRLVHLGLIAEQFVKKDESLLLRFEASVEELFSKKVHVKKAFGLDDPENWFDEVRASRAQKPVERPAAGARPEVPKSVSAASPKPAATDTKPPVTSASVPSGSVASLPSAQRSAGAQ